eukprot:2099990-Rhodomonas_salina.1
MRVNWACGVETCGHMPVLPACSSHPRSEGPQLCDTSEMKSCGRVVHASGFDETMTLVAMTGWSQFAGLSRSSYTNDTSAK